MKTGIGDGSIIWRYSYRLNDATGIAKDKTGNIFRWDVEGTIADPTSCESS